MKVDPSARDSGDRTVFGWKSGILREPEYWKPLLKTIIKNTYRTLMTRGMKGCYIYCTDSETADYFKEQMAISSGEPKVDETYARLMDTFK